MSVRTKAADPKVALIHVKCTALQLQDKTPKYEQLVAQSEQRLQKGWLHHLFPRRQCQCRGRTLFWWGGKYSGQFKMLH